MSTFRDGISDELRRLDEDMLYTEKAHFATAAFHSRLHMSLGALATVAAAVAAATIVAETAPWISGIAALVAAVASAVVTFVKPEETAQKHLNAGRSLGALRVRVRQSLNLDLHPDTTDAPARLREMVDKYAAGKAAIDATAPSVSDRAFAAGSRKIQAGIYDHDSAS